MPPPSRTFRVFISSTFADLQAERHALQMFVLPRLRELCAIYGARFQAVDLRWGISADAGEDQQTLDICLREVERCQRLTPRPNFLILLGDRYGWRPLPADIAVDEFDAIRSVTDGEKECQLLDEWYWRDDNVVPPRFVLRSRMMSGEIRPEKVRLKPDTTEEWHQVRLKPDTTGEGHQVRLKPDTTGDAGDAEDAGDGWSDVERALAATLRHAVARLEWEPRKAAPYVTSATEREIERGLFSMQTAGTHVSAVRRRMVNLPHDARAHSFLDLDRGGTPDGEAAALLERLRGRLIESLGSRMVDIPATWSGDSPSPDHLGSLPATLEACLPLLDDGREPMTVCGTVWRGVGSVIRAECDGARERPAQDRERDAHVAFRDERAAIVIGRDIELARIAAYIDGDEPGPLAILGTFGSGKSALVARAIVDAESRLAAAGGTGDASGQLSTSIAFRFVGATAASTSGVPLLRGLGAEIAADPATADPPATLKALTDWFPGLLARVSATRRLLIFIDALDQLAGNDGARTLAWLPHTLPPNVRIIVSAAPGDVTRILEGRQAASCIVRVDKLALASGAELLDTWVHGAGRTLQSAQRNEVLTSFSTCGLPLHLRLAFEEARRWRSFDPPTDLADDVSGLVRQLFARLSREANHGPELVQRSLGYVAAGRNGLTEDEIIDVLSADAVLMGDVRRRSPDSPDVDRLPPIVWSRFYDEIEPYLTWRDADGTSTLGFFHRQLADVAAADFLGDADRAVRHAALADYFAAQPPQSGPSTNLRRLSELPWHLAGAARWDAFVDTVATFSFLDARLRTAGPQAVVDDFDLALEMDTARAELAPPALEALTTLRAFVRLTTHILGRDPSQLTAQIAGRIDTHSNPILVKVVEEAAAGAPSPSLQPSDRSLAPPGGDLIATLTGHAKEVHAVAITPDGAFGASGSADGTLRVWDLDRQVERFIVPVGHGEVRSVVVTPDGRSIVSGSEDGSIDIWDVASGVLIRRWQGTYRWRALVITPDGKHLLSESDGPAILWDFATGEEIFTIQPGSVGSIAIAISSDARRAAIGGIYDYVSLWDLEQRREIVTLPQGHDSWVSAVAITPDGRFAFSADWNGLMKVWDVETHRQVGQLIGHGYKKVTAMTLTPDGSRIATADNYFRLVVHRWSPDANTPGGRIEDAVLKVVSTAAHGIQQLALTPDGGRAITSGTDGTLRVWDIAADPKQAPGSIYVGGYSDDNDDVHHITWSRVLVTDVHASAPPAFHVNDSSAPATGRWSIVSRRSDRRRRPWDSEEDWRERDSEPCAFQIVERGSGSESPVIETGFCVMLPAVSADGTLLASLDYERQITVWNLATGTHLQSVPLDEPGTTRQDPNVPHIVSRGWLTFSADNRLLLCAIDETIALWDIASGTRLVSPEGSFTFTVPSDTELPLTTPRFTADAAHVLAASARRFVGVWKVGEASPVSKWSLPPSAEFGLTPDGRTAWWFTRNGLLRHWTVKARDTSDQREGPVREPFGRPRMFSVVTPSVRLSADGRFAFAIDKEGRWRVWQLPHRVPIIDRVAPDLRAVAVYVFAQHEPGVSWRGLLACGGSRLEVFDLPSMNLLAAFDGDGAFDHCEFESDTLVSASADGRRHRLRLRRV